MKILLLPFLIVLAYSIGSAQTRLDCINNDLETAEKIRQADTCIWNAADYVLSKPLGLPDTKAHECRKFILQWMDKTPDYTFTLNSAMMELFKGDNIILFGVYTTTLARAAVEYKKDFEKEALRIFVSYITNPDNKVEQTSKIKKLIKDFEAGKTDRYIR